MPLKKYGSELPVKGRISGPQERAHIQKKLKEKFDWNCFFLKDLEELFSDVIDHVSSSSRNASRTLFRVFSLPLHLKNKN